MTAGESWSYEPLDGELKMLVKLSMSAWGTLAEDADIVASYAMPAPSREGQEPKAVRLEDVLEPLLDSDRHGNLRAALQRLSAVVLCGRLDRNSAESAAAAKGLVYYLAKTGRQDLLGLLKTVDDRVNRRDASPENGLMVSEVLFLHFGVLFQDGNALSAARWIPPMKGLPGSFKTLAGTMMDEVDAGGAASKAILDILVQPEKLAIPTRLEFPSGSGGGGSRTVAQRVMETTVLRAFPSIAGRLLSDGARGVVMGPVAGLEGEKACFHKLSGNPFGPDMARWQILHYFAWAHGLPAGLAEKHMDERDSTGWSVAHSLALRPGERFQARWADLRDARGITPAHVHASVGGRVPERYWDLSDRNGTTVFAAVLFSCRGEEPKAGPGLLDRIAGWVRSRPEQMTLTRGDVAEMDVALAEALVYALLERGDAWETPAKRRLWTPGGKERVRRGKKVSAVLPWLLTRLVKSRGKEAIPLLGVFLESARTSRGGEAVVENVLMELKRAGFCPRFEEMAARWRAGQSMLSNDIEEGGIWL